MPGNHRFWRFPTPLCYHLRKSKFVSRRQQAAGLVSLYYSRFTIHALMKTLYFDCFAGASGDMILGALVAAGVRPQELKDQLSLLGVSGYAIDFETVNRSGISATYARVQAAHEHAHRHLPTS